MPPPHNKRFKLTMYMSKKNCPIENDIYMVRDMEFYTIMDASKFLRMNYNVVNAIYKGKHKKYSDAPCIPTIVIEKIMGGY